MNKEMVKVNDTTNKELVATNKKRALSFLEALRNPRLDWEKFVSVAAELYKVAAKVLTLRGFNHEGCYLVQDLSRALNNELDYTYKYKYFGSEEKILDILRNPSAHWSDYVDIAEILDDFVSSIKKYLGIHYFVIEDLVREMGVEIGIMEKYKNSTPMLEVLRNPGEHYSKFKDYCKAFNETLQYTKSTGTEEEYAMIAAIATDLDDELKWIDKKVYTRVYEREVSILKIVRDPINNLNELDQIIPKLLGIGATFKYPIVLKLATELLNEWPTC